MAADAGDALLGTLQEHNPWWERGVDAFSLPPRAKSDFYHLARPGREGSQFEDQALLGLVGRRGVGKTTLLRQFVHQRIEAGAAPEQFLYLPMDADPLYQLQSDEQLRRAVRYYESRVLGRSEPDGPQFVLVDDVHLVEHPKKPNVEGWGSPVADLLGTGPNDQMTLSDLAQDRHVVVTASAAEQIDRELDRVGFEEGRYDTQPILPEKFRDYVFTLYPDLEEEQNRISPTSLRTGENSLPATLESGNVDPFVEELRSKYEQVAGMERRIQSQVVDYLAMGGIISYDHDGAVGSSRDLGEGAYERLRNDVRNALYQEVPGFESIQTIADLERLCALAARDRAAEPIRYQRLVDLFDVDRRTLSDSYLSALKQLYLLNGVTEYDNQRPRSVRLFLRDTGLVTALSEGDAAAAHGNFEFEADLARVAAFDHTMRFAYGVNAAQGNEVEPSVQFWRGREGEVEFVFEVGETPVPVALAYRSGDREASVAAVQEFRSKFGAPVGLVLAGDTIRSTQPVAEVDGGIVQLPYWLYLMIS
jgi:predicted AAA+ superfamily ATPase